MILDKTVSISRLTKNPLNAAKESYSAVPGLTGVGMNIQPASAELTVVAGGVYGNTYQGFTTVTGIYIGDLVTISGQAAPYGVFTVKGVKDWNFPPIPHLEIVLFQGEQ